MTVLVTGGAGYVGSHAVLALLAAGHPVAVLDDLSTGFRPLVPAEVPFFIGDCGDAGLVSRIAVAHDVDCVMHFAGSTVVPDSVSDPLGYYRNNTSKTRNLVEACVASGIESFVFSSTAAVYGSPGEGLVGEDAALSAESPYGRSKLMTEWMLADAAAAHGIRYAALRHFNVAGADPDGRSGQTSQRSTHLVKVACEASLGRRPGMSVYGTDYPTRDGTCVRNYIHVSDLVDAHVLALDRIRSGGDPIVANLGCGSGFTVQEVVDTVRRVGGRDFEVRYEGRRPGDAASVVADPATAMRELGWRPMRNDIDVIVMDALLWETRLTGAGLTGAVVE